MPFADTPSRTAVGGVFRCSLPMRWGDLDALGHVNNTAYFRYVEEARVRLYDQAGLAMQSERVGVLVHAACDFVKSLVYPGEVVVELTLARVGRSSMEFDVFIGLEGEPGVVYARGKNVVVCTDMVRNCSSPWSPAELEGLLSCFTRPGAGSDGGRGGSPAG